MKVMTLREKAQAVVDGTYEDSPGTFLHARHVAQAWLEANPADDDEPIDEAWLLSVGMRFSWGQYELGPLMIELFADSVDDKPDVEAVVNGIVPNVKTRGQVRAILSALGIPNQTEA